MIKGCLAKYLFDITSSILLKLKGINRIFYFWKNIKNPVHRNNFEYCLNWFIEMS